MESSKVYIECTVFPTGIDDDTLLKSGSQVLHIWIWMVSTYVGVYESVTKYSDRISLSYCHFYWCFQSPTSARSSICLKIVRACCQFFYTRWPPSFFWKLVSICCFHTENDCFDILPDFRPKHDASSCWFVYVHRKILDLPSILLPIVLKATDFWIVTFILSEFRSTLFSPLY